MSQKKWTDKKGLNKLSSTEQKQLLFILNKISDEDEVSIGKYRLKIRQLG